MNKTGLSDFFGYDKNDKKSLLRTLVICALMIAISVVLKKVLEIPVPLFGVKGQSVNFSFTIIVFTGFLFGPIWGGAVGAISDLLGAVLFPQGAIILGLTLTNFIIGFSAGLLAIFMKKKLYTPNSAQFLLILFFCLFVSLISSPMNSYWIWLMYNGGKTPFIAYLIPRLAISLLTMFPINTLILWLLMNKVVPALKKAKLI